MLRRAAHLREPSEPSRCSQPGPSGPRRGGRRGGVQRKPGGFSVYLGGSGHGRSPGSSRPYRCSLATGGTDRSRAGAHRTRPCTSWPPLPGIPKFSACHPQARQAKVVGGGASPWFSVRARSSTPLPGPGSASERRGCVARVFSEPSTSVAGAGPARWVAAPCGLRPPPGSHLGGVPLVGATDPSSRHHCG